MLGLAQASQYAGWWNSGLRSVAFSGAGAIADVVEQSPAYSWLTDQSSQVWQVVDDFSPGSNGNVDLTGLTGFTGFNNRRMTYVASVYVSSSGTYNSAESNWFNTLEIGGTAWYFNINMTVASVSGTNRLRFYFQPGNGADGGATVNTPTVITNYLDQWLTVVASTAETSSAFVDWTGPTVTGTAVRLCIYNTLTGALIAKTDAANNTIPAPALNTLPTTLPVNRIASSSNNLYCNGNAGPATPTYTTNWWITFGQCFDPVAATDTSWRTSSPSAVISSAKAWINAQYTNVATVSPVSHYGSTSGQDLYSQASNYLLDWTRNSPVWLLGYNTTIILRDAS